MNLSEDKFHEVAYYSLLQIAEWLKTVKADIIVNWLGLKNE